MTSSKNGNSNLSVKESPKHHHMKPIKIPSENLISTASMSSSKTSNLHYKSKSRNSTANNHNNLNNNNNLTSNGTETKEKTSINQVSTNSNLSKVKRVSDTSHIKDSKIRRDAKGNPIVKGRKKHRVSFKDVLDKNADLVEVVEIESFKDYNAEELSIVEDKNATFGNQSNTRNGCSGNDNTSCTCIVF